MLGPLLAAALLLGQQQAAELSMPVVAGKGRVVFYRTGGIQFSGRGCPLFEGHDAGASRIAGLGGGEYFVFDADPGVHSFAASSKLKKAVRLELAAGETQFVRCELSGFPGSAKLRESARSEFEAHRAKLDPAD